MEYLLAYVKGFLILYLLIKVLLFLVPKSGFTKYISFFAGVVLVIGLLYPVLSLGKGMESLDGMENLFSFGETYEMTTKGDGLWEESEKIYKEQLEGMVEDEINNQITREGFFVKSVQVTLTDTYEVKTLKIVISGGEEENRGELETWLREQYQININQCEILYE